MTEETGVTKVKVVTVVKIVTVVIGVILKHKM